MNSVFLCLGGNLGNRLENLQKAFALINAECGKIAKCSHIYESEPWGSSSKNKYLNQVIELKTAHSPRKLMYKLLGIEAHLGRKRTKNKNDDRIIDIDILLFNKEHIDREDLQIPHPRMHQREFVLAPLNEIASKYKHPELKRSINQLYKDLPKKGEARKFHPYKFICIEGNIGGGKTTFSKALALSQGAKFLEEKFENTPLLDHFYQNPKKYALAVELSFLFDRYEQLVNHIKLNQGKTTICDYTFYKSLWFAKMNLSKNDFKYFRRIFLKLEKDVPKPQAIIYLATSISNLQKNIKKRGRIYEQQIDTKYLEKINKSYAKGLSSLANIKIIKLSIPQYSLNHTKSLIKRLNKTINNL